MPSPAQHPALAAFGTTQQPGARTPSCDQERVLAQAVRRLTRR